MHFWVKDVKKILMVLSVGGIVLIFAGLCMIISMKEMNKNEQKET